MRLRFSTLKVSFPPSPPRVPPAATLMRRHWLTLHLWLSFSALNAIPADEKECDRTFYISFRNKPLQFEISGKSKALEHFEAAVEQYAHEAVVPTVTDVLSYTRDYLDSLSERALLLILRDMVEKDDSATAAAAGGGGGGGAGTGKQPLAVDSFDGGDEYDDKYEYEYIDEEDLEAEEEANDGGGQQGSSVDGGSSPGSQTFPTARGVLGRPSRSVSFGVSSGEFAL